MRFSSAVEEFFEEREKFLSAETVRKYKRVLNDLVALASLTASNNVVAFTPGLARAYFTALANKGLAPATLITYKAALGEFAEWCRIRRLIADSPLRELPAVRLPRSLPRPFSSAAEHAILALALPPTEALLRALLYEAGLRVAEVSRLTVGAVDLGADELHGELRIFGKGSKTRVVPLTPALWYQLRDYLLSHSRIDRLEAFVIARPSGERFTEGMIRARTRQWGKAAQVAKVTPHRFRHTFATRLYRDSGDIRVVQTILGHESIQTTQRYTEVSPEQVRAAVQKLGSRANFPVDDSQRRVPEGGQTA